MNSKVTSIRAVRKISQELLQKIPYLCVSSVEGGALLMTEKNTCFGRIPSVQIKSTVGAGDSMVGAMTAAFYRGVTSQKDILKWGLAAAAATLEKPGTALASTQRIHQLFTVTKVSLI